MTHDTKTCPRCGVAKALSAFAAARGRKGGLSGWCKVCRVEDAAERRTNLAQERTELRLMVTRLVAALEGREGIQSVLRDAKALLEE